MGKDTLKGTMSPIRDLVSWGNISPLNNPQRKLFSSKAILVLFVIWLIAQEECKATLVLKP